MSNASKFLHELLFRLGLVYLIYKCSYNMFHVNFFQCCYVGFFTVVLELF